ncbi:floral homeotic protein DEFICIENS-like [Impatiens glandulifera]|nr:floral homeotic protein DEFICIENS-like [Impatiens glandulifera]XP_047324018.1 floral homeotic protein DEFICIENS-like [Impatiens glandulifera]
MARGKIQIKRIENDTNRQVTYSKRRNGLFKKAGELTVLCDAKVSIIMFSSTSKLHEYMSSSISTKQMFDHYQKTLGVDLWNTQYEKMQEQLKKVKDVNRGLRREISQRMGENLNELCYEELMRLEQEVDNSLQQIRDRKFKVLGNQIEIHKKKLRNVEQTHRNLLQEFDVRGEEENYGMININNNKEGEYDDDDVVVGGEIGVGFHGFMNRSSNGRILNTNNNQIRTVHSGGGAVGLDLTTYALL